MNKCGQQRLNTNGQIVVKRKIVHLLKIALAGKISFQKCPPALSLNRYPRFEKKSIVVRF